MGRWFLFASALAMASADGYGLSLEQSLGGVTLGRPLDIVVPINLSNADSGTDVCEQAVVYLGESLLAPHLVQLSRLSDGGGTRQRLRVQTKVPVNEPYVSVELSAGCVGRQTRVFTLLADMPTTAPMANAIASVATVAPPAIRQPVVPRTPLALDSESGAGSAAPRVASLPPRSRTVEPATRSVPAVTAASVAQTVSPARKPAAVKPGPVLKLDPIDLAEDAATWMPRLALSMELPKPSDAPVPDIEATRAQARHLWSVLLEPEKVGAASAAQVETLQAQLASARAALDAASQLQADQALLMEEEQSSRYASPVFLGLVAALLAALAGLGVMWRGRQRGESSSDEWWKPARLVDEPFRQLAERRRAAKSREAELADRGGAASTLDVAMDSLFPADAFKRSTHSTPGDSQLPNTRPGNSAFLPSVLPGTSTSFLAEELFDLQQQVEFFISLGQSEQAVEVLLNHLSDGHEPSPLAYLDLLKLYHQMGLRDKYQSLMTEFNAQFNAAAPSFDNYSQSRRGLERYAKALSRIQSLWPSPAVLQLIETSLFRQPGAHSDEMFDIEAYRELLLLYGVAREIIADASPPEHPPSASVAEHVIEDVALPNASATGFGATSLQPLSAREPAKPTLAIGEPLAGMDPASSAHAALDLDLSDDFAVIQPADSPGLPALSAADTVQDSPAPDAGSHTLDFDFTDLDARPAMAIKKSGPAS